MSYEIDLENMETQSLVEAADWNGKQVLEIGCGEGRLTRRIASLEASVTAVDPQFDRLQSAVSPSWPATPRQVRYCLSDGQQLPFAFETFDIVLFGWSLWWFPHEGMVHALREAWRVLRPGAELIDLRPTGEIGQVGLLRGGGFTAAAETEAAQEDTRAAEAALLQAMNQKLLALSTTRRFPLIFLFPSLEILNEWLQDFYEMSAASSHILVRRIEKVVNAQQTPAEIGAVVPFVLRVYQKRPSQAHPHTSRSAG